MVRNILRLGLLGLAIQAGWAQPPEFEVISVKPNKTGSFSSTSNTHNGTLTATNVSLMSFIMQAYGVFRYQVSGPEWLDDEHFDVAAKGAGDAQREQIRQMMQGMLRDRFKLVLHREQKVLPVYGLVIAKGGLKVKPVEDTGSHSSNGSHGRLEVMRISWTALGSQLSHEMDRPVLDMTGDKGVYNFTLQWSPEESAGASGESRTDTPAYPPLAMALEQQLGLKLEARKAPVEILVIDHLERAPAEN